MENQEWSRLGDEVKNVVESAVETQDYKQLNQAIEKTVSAALEQVGKGLNQAGKTIQDSMQRTQNAEEIRNQQKQKWKQTYAEQQKQYRSYNEYAKWYLNIGRRDGETTKKAHAGDDPAVSVRAGGNGNSRAAVQAIRKERYSDTAFMTVVSLLMAASGFVFMTPFAIISIISLFGWAAGNYGALYGALNTFFVLPLMLTLTALCALLGGSGVSLYKRQQRFKSYVAYLGDREFCNVEELQKVTQRSRRFILKDLTRMIHSRMFRQGHLDKQGTCLMVTEQAYRQYQTAQLSLEQRQQEQALEKQREQEPAQQQKEKGRQKEVWKNPQLSPEAKAVIREGFQYLDQIRQSNDAIPGEEISQKISRLELVIGKIFERVEQHPELIDDLRKFMDYYLPTTVKLLKAYEEMDAQPVQGSNIVSSKKEIENTLDTISLAFENLLDSFFEDTAWDISTDITVLRTMLAQEGLTDHNKFKKES